MKQIFLKPGEICFQEVPSELTTIVGSCVAVCLWDKVRHVGGMCHYYLPRKHNGEKPDNFYGDHAILNTIRYFKKLGSQKRDIEAKVLGGGHVINFRTEHDGDIGRLNIEVAFSVLKKIGIRVLGKAVGGAFGKKIKFHTDTGKVEFKDIVSENPRISVFKHLIVIGASTGGTEAIKEVLTRLPQQIPPIVIVQHIPGVFSENFANRLNELCPFTVYEAEHDMKIEPNTAYVSPGGKHLTIVQRDNELYTRISNEPPVNRFKPSVDVLFNSALQVRGKKIIGILLTGMGYDGANGLLKLKNNGAQTIAQSEESCVVYGMPKAAVELGAALWQLDLPQIAQKIVSLVYDKEKG